MYAPRELFAHKIMMILSGIDEADGNERMVTLGSLVFQVFRLHDHLRCNYDGLFPRKSWRRPRNYHLWRSDCYASVSVAVFHFSDDLLLRHLNVLFKRFDLDCCVTNINDRPITS